LPLCVLFAYQHRDVKPCLPYHSTHLCNLSHVSWLFSISLFPLLYRTVSLWNLYVVTDLLILQLSLESHLIQLFTLDTIAVFRITNDLHNSELIEFFLHHYFWFLKAISSFFICSIFTWLSKHHSLDSTHTYFTSHSFNFTPHLHW
jgi:hypothetical protein